MTDTITLEQAQEMGAKGAPATEPERLLFEAWMRGHCWAVIGEWNGETYIHPHESGGFVVPSAMNTRQLWAAWRDRAALAQQAEPTHYLDAMGLCYTAARAKFIGMNVESMVALYAAPQVAQQAADKMAMEHKVERDTLTKRIAELESMEKQNSDTIIWQADEIANHLNTIESSRKQEPIAWKYTHIPSWHTEVSLDHPEKTYEWDDLQLLEIEPLFAAPLVYDDQSKRIAELEALKDAQVAQQAEQVQRTPIFTTGHCKEKAKVGGCQLHNLQCSYPACDRVLAAAPKGGV